MRSEYKPGRPSIVKAFNKRKFDPYFSGPIKIYKKKKKKKKKI